VAVVAILLEIRDGMVVQIEKNKTDRRRRAGKLFAYPRDLFTAGYE